jgi:hypothetical protein
MRFPFSDCAGDGDELDFMGRRGSLWYDPAGALSLKITSQVEHAGFGRLLVRTISHG